MDADDVVDRSASIDACSGKFHGGNANLCGGSFELFPKSDLELQWQSQVTFAISPTPTVWDTQRVVACDARMYLRARYAMIGTQLRIVLPGSHVLLASPQRLDAQHLKVSCPFCVLHDSRSSHRRLAEDFARTSRT
eukprot:2270746-Rhodomonas_salina.2